jgi:hypothetical protein
MSREKLSTSYQQVINILNHDKSIASVSNVGNEKQYDVFFIDPNKEKESNKERESVRTKIPEKIAIIYIYNTSTIQDLVNKLDTTSTITGLANKLDSGSMDPGSMDLARTNDQAVSAKPNYNKSVLDNFKIFWTAYPAHRREKKVRALSAFARINPKPELFKKMLEALEAFKKSEQWNKDNGTYIPHPSSWLNARRWEDESLQIKAFVPKYEYTAQEFDNLPQDVKNQFEWQRFTLFINGEPNSRFRPSKK